MEQVLDYVLDFSKVALGFYTVNRLYTLGKNYIVVWSMNRRAVESVEKGLRK